MKINGRGEVQFYALLATALDGGEWSASCPGHFPHRERVPVPST